MENTEADTAGDSQLAKTRVMNRLNREFGCLILRRRYEKEGGGGIYDYDALKRTAFFAAFVTGDGMS